MTDKYLKPLTPTDATLSFENCLFSHSERSFQGSSGHADVTKKSSYKGKKSEERTNGSVAMRVTVKGYKTAIAKRETYIEKYIVTEGN